MRYKSIFFIMILSALISGCIKKEITVQTPYDLEILEQKPYLYIHEDITILQEEKVRLYSDFLVKFFKPWDIEQISYDIEIAKWAFEYTQKTVYGENHLLITKEWFDNIIEYANFEDFNTQAKKAITINNSHLRALPTQSVIFYNPQKAGEGFPFDYNQNSSIKPNIPLFISHFSKDGLWAFVESNFALGWISLKDIAFVDDDFISEFRNNNYFVNTKDNTLIYSNNYLVDNLEIGTILPQHNDKFVYVSKDYAHNAFIVYIDKNDNFRQFPLDFNRENIKLLSSQLIGQKYGWGGLYGHRDCSSMIRDFYMPFGIFLQRNSSDQKKDGIVHEIGHLSNQDKKDFIVQNGIPFLTIVYLRGHTMIYIGHVDKEPLVFHNVWGIRTLESDGSIGRYIVGRAVVSTLELGKDLPESKKDALLIDRVESITIVAEQQFNE